MNLLLSSLEHPTQNPPGIAKRAPLTSWEEYAQALLQANETSFVN
jgi:hypothetical protein